MAPDHCLQWAWLHVIVASLTSSRFRAVRTAQEIIGNAVAAGGQTVVFFEVFYSKMHALLYKGGSRGVPDGNEYAKSGTAREEDSREEARSGGSTLGKIGMLIGTAAGRAGRARDQQYDHLLGSSPDGLFIGRDGRKWLWEHKEVSPKVFNAPLKQVRPYTHDICHIRPTSVSLIAVIH